MKEKFLCGKIFLLIEMDNVKTIHGVRDCYDCFSITYKTFVGLDTPYSFPILHKRQLIVVNKLSKFITSVESLL